MHFRYDQIVEAHSHTFEWLFENTSLRFEDWLRSGTGIYWISGKPASGKSTLMKYAFSHPRTSAALSELHLTSTKVMAGFFFHERGSANQKSLTGLLHSILYQILRCDPQLTSAIAPYYTALHPDPAGRRMWTTPTMKKAIRAIIDQTCTEVNICLFLDALDEYDGDYNDIAAFLKDLVGQQAGSNLVSKTNIKICLSSRREPLLIDLFGTNPGFQIHEHTLGDISIYVRSRLEEHPRMSLYLTTEDKERETANDLISNIVTDAEGVFLWVSLVVNDLLRGLADGDDINRLQTRLNALPKNLEGLYQRILERIPENYRLESYMMLEIVLCAREPLTLHGFTCAVALAPLKPESHVIPVSLAQSNEDRNRADMIRRLTSRCGGLIEVKDISTQDMDLSPRKFKTNQTVSFVQFLHRSVKEFLAQPASSSVLFASSQQAKPSENGHLYLLRSCLRYLMVFHNDAADEDAFQSEVVIRTYRYTDYRPYKTNTFVGHATCNWYRYAKMAETTIGEPQVSIIDKFGNPQKQAFRGWAFYWSARLIHLNYTPPSIEGFAVSCGLVLYIQSKLKAGFRIDRVPGIPPLLLAINPRMARVIPSDLNMVSILLDAGASVNEEYEGSTAMSLVMDQSQPINLDVFRLLLQHGACPNNLLNFPYGHRKRPPWKQMYPLHLTLRNQNAKAADLLLQHGANPEMESPDGKLPMDIVLASLVHSPNAVLFELVNMLLEHGARFREGDQEAALASLRSGIWYKSSWDEEKYHHKAYNPHLSAFRALLPFFSWSN